MASICSLDEGGAWGSAKRGHKAARRACPVGRVFGEALDQPGLLAPGRARETEMRWASATIESTTEAPPAFVASPGRSQQNEDGRQLIATMRAIARRASSGSTLTSCSRSGERIAELPERGHLMERHSASARTGSKRLPGASLLTSGAAGRRRDRQLAPHLGPLERSGKEARPAPRDPTLSPVAFSACASGRRPTSWIGGPSCGPSAAKTRGATATRPGPAGSWPNQAVAKECHASAFMR